VQDGGEEVVGVVAVSDSEALEPVENAEFEEGKGKRRERQGKAEGGSAFNSAKRKDGLEGPAEKNAGKNAPRPAS
jgi:hypothetical protein